MNTGGPCLMRILLLFKDFLFYCQSTSFEQNSSSFNSAVKIGPNFVELPTPLKNKSLCQHFRALRLKSKSWKPFWSYQLKSTASWAHLDQFHGKWAGFAVLFSSKTAPQILISSITISKCIWVEKHWDMDACLFWA